jgi:hypothetical protein
MGDRLLRLAPSAAVNKRALDVMLQAAVGFPSRRSSAVAPPHVRAASEIPSASAL